MKKTLLICLLSLFALTGCSFGYTEDVGGPTVDKPIGGVNEEFIPKDFDNDYSASEEITYATNFEQNYNATVRMRAYYNLTNKQEYKISSGFVYKVDGEHHYIVTSALRIGYLVEDMKEFEMNYNGLFEVRLNDGRKYKADLVGTFQDYDIAVFDVKTKDFLPTAILGSSDDIKIGNDVGAIGTPDILSDLFNTYIEGTVSGLNRRITITTNYNHVVTSYGAFQFDAPTNYGMEGGVVLNSLDEVVGIISFKNSGKGDYESLSFAIAIDDAKNIIDNLIANKKYVKPVLGFRASNLDYLISNSDMADNLSWAYDRDIYSGILVRDVDKKSKADNAGLKANSIVVGVKDMAGRNYSINSMEDLQSQLVRLNSGDFIILKVAVKNSPTIQEIRINL